MPERWRSVLFAPADQPTLLGKMAATGTDVAVADLEDAVAPASKATAREVVAEQLPAIVAGVTATRFFVRVNAPSSEWFTADVAALPEGIAGIVVPKVERTDDVDAVRAALRDRGLGDVALLAGIETAAGVAAAATILRGGADACYFGAEDFITDMGGRRTAEGREVLFARSQVALAARLAGVPAVDQVVVDIHDDERFVADAEAGRAIGYAGKLCVHPSQVALALRCFSPQPGELERALRLLDAQAEASRAGVGTFAFEGQMVDEPLLRRARAIIESAEVGPAGIEPATKGL